MTRSQSGHLLTLDIDVELFCTNEEIVVQGAYASLAVTGLQFRAPLRLVFAPLAPNRPTSAPSASRSSTPRL